MKWGIALVTVLLAMGPAAAATKIEYSDLGIQMIRIKLILALIGEPWAKDASNLLDQQQELLTQQQQEVESLQRSVRFWQRLAGVALIVGLTGGILGTRWYYRPRKEPAPGPQHHDDP